MSKIDFKKVKPTAGYTFNKNAMEGIACKILKQAPDYIDNIIRTGVNSLDPDIGLEYLGYRILPPKEAYKNNYSMSTTRNSVDISKSTTYKVAFMFRLHGEPLERVLVLPYAEKGGIIRLSDAVYYVNPVLTEYVISAKHDNIFIRLLKDKVMINRYDRTFIINGNKEIIPLIVSRLYKFTDSNPKTPVVLLPLTKHGLGNFLDRYTDITINDVIFTDREITPKDLEEYDVYASTGKRPRVFKEVNYVPHNIKILIPKGKRSFLLDNLFSSIIHAFDLLPDFSRQVLKVIGTKNEHRFWKYVLGRTILRHKYEKDKLLARMDEYLNLVDNYLDTIIDKKLKEIGILVDDYHDLLVYIVKNFEHLVQNYEERSSSLKTRYIDILYYLLYDIMDGLNRSFYSINKDGSKKKLTKKDINKIFNKHFSVKKIYRLVKGGAVNIVLTPVNDAVTDNWYWKITNTIEDQNRGEGVKRSKNNAFPAFMRTIHAEDLILGSILYISKKAPTPRLRMNPTIKINKLTNRIETSEKQDKTIEKLDAMLNARFIDDELVKQTLINDDDMDLD